MIAFPEIEPVIIQIGPLQIRWYGLMYVLGFTATYLLVQHQIKKQSLYDFAAHFENLNLLLIVSLVVGGRLGYVLFYNLPYYIENPLEIVATWHGGMSFHGALLTLIFAGYWFCRKKGLDFWKAADLYIVTVPIGLGLGRLGNFINGELFGRVTDVPWAMIFPTGGPLPRHPSQLYECFLEGVLLFVILWTLKEKKLPSGSLLGLFLLFYGIFRIIVEFFREPDAHLGFVVSVVTMGQLLSSFMIIGGILLFFLRYRRCSVGR